MVNLAFIWKLHSRDPEAPNLSGEYLTVTIVIVIEEPKPRQEADREA